MKAEEIRKKSETYSAAMKEVGNVDSSALIVEAAKLEMIIEIAAQLAEANEHLTKIANPLLVVDAESPWLTLKWRDREFVVNRDDVSSVHQYGSSGTESVVILRTDAPEDGGRCCETGLTELCAKLKIPFKEQP